MTWTAVVGATVNLSQSTAVMYTAAMQCNFEFSRQGHLEPMTLPLPEHWHSHGMQPVLCGIQVSSSATPEVGGRGSSADGFGSLIGSRQASPPDPATGPLSRQTSAGRQPLAPLPSSDRSVTLSPPVASA